MILLYLSRLQRLDDLIRGLRFLQPSVLELFRRILEDPYIDVPKPKLQEHADLKSLIEYILKRFFKTVKENPLMLLEVRRVL